MTTVLLDILVVLLAAKLAAEVAERAGVPAVVGEILAGVAVGPSALGLVGDDEVLRVLGELGVILLLLEVGLSMDLVELTAVGRASLAVAVAGVTVPFATGTLTGLAFSMDVREAVFVGAALTATSVGITARVFGDLRALASVEARIVLGAAVADDVIGLVILTVVVRIVSEGTVSVVTVAGVVAVALGFLVVTSVAGMRLAPPLFDGLARYSRSSGTVVALALAFTLAFAELAHAAKLAPIVGAFVAGLSLAPSPPAERIRRELTPIGHLLIPVFFLQIGIDADVGRFADARALRLAAVLLVVAVAGKLVSALALGRAPGDRLLIGIGMIPRGEVGLIFATIGLQEKVFGQDVYAALLMVVLATTVGTPPLLRARLLRIRAARAAMQGGGGAAAPGACLWVDETHAGPLIELAAEPSPADALGVALEAAVLAEKARPGASLLTWMSSLPPGPLRWNPLARRRFFELLDVGGPRSWRLLSMTGVLDRAVPDLAPAVARRQADASEIDPLGTPAWPRLSRLAELDGLAGTVHLEHLRLAAVLLDATEHDRAANPVVVARRLAPRLELGARAEESITQMLADADLLTAAARRVDAFAEEAVLTLATHLAGLDQAVAEFRLAHTDSGLSDGDLLRLDELEALVLAALAHPDLTGREARNAVEERRLSASRLTDDPEVRERIATAPRAYVLATDAEDLLLHARLCEPLPGAGVLRVSVRPGTPAAPWRLSVAARDRPGLLAVTTAVLAEHGLDILGAVVAAWGDGGAVGDFHLRGPTPDAERLTADLTAALRRRPEPVAAPDADLTFDDLASPWHTLCTVRAPDRIGLLHALAAAFSAAGADVHAARVATRDDEVVDLFELTDTRGRKLSADIQQRIRALLASPAGLGGRRLRGRRRGARR